MHHGHRHGLRWPCIILHDEWPPTSTRPFDILVQISKLFLHRIFLNRYIYYLFWFFMEKTYFSLTESVYVWFSVDFICWFTLCLSFCYIIKPLCIDHLLYDNIILPVICAYVFFIIYTRTAFAQRYTAKDWVKLWEPWLKRGKKDYMRQGVKVTTGERTETTSLCF